jgi:hypothetical protein
VEGSYVRWPTSPKQLASSDFSGLEGAFVCIINESAPSIKAPSPPK